MSFFGGTNGEAAPPEGVAREPLPINIRLIVRWGIVILALVLVFVVLWVARAIYTDWLWYDQLGYLNVFTTIVSLRIWLFFAGFGLFAIFIAINLYVAHRLSRGESILPVPRDVYRLMKRGTLAVTVVTALIMSVVFGIVVASRWETFLLFFNKVPFNVADPQFGRDISFYVATLPVLHFIQGWLQGAVIALAVAAAALYGVTFALRGIPFSLTPRILGHVAVLGLFLMLTIAVAHYLDIFELVFSQKGAAPGAAATDVNSRIPILYLLTAIALLSAVGFGVSRFIGGLRLMVGAFSLWAVLALAAGLFFPEAYQRVRVNPNEFTREAEFIGRNIQATRQAYGIDSMEERVFEYQPSLSREDVQNNPETIKNVRLWDPAPLRAVYNQIQFFELYYNFVDVDVDRYIIDGEKRQVMLSARELFPQNLDPEDQNWVNQKLQYTHGFGAAVSPVTEFTTEGRPNFLLNNIPPEGELGLARPEVYYGENTTDFVIVNSKTTEFDHQPPDTGPVYKNYEGEGDVQLSSLLRRIAYFWEFADINVLISGQITSESRILYRREIRERVNTIAPFLHLDRDPYLVVTDDKLRWIMDGYTVTDRYAYSTRSGGNLFEEDVNYIRNSVKIVIDAYDGTVDFFVIDPEDPLIQMYQKAFPILFKSFDDMADSLKPHIRYPEDLFTIQSEINLKYHMQDPNVFFNKQDQWRVGDEVFGNDATQTQPVKPYYVIMTLPGETEEEFVLILPFTPLVGEKMVAWMAARNDDENYGKLLTFTFPRGLQVDGPEQVEARITSDETLGKELSLLCPVGKLCIRGNLLVIPIGNSILYVEPLFIRPEALDFPELKKVIVADSTAVIMADTLSDALNQLLGEAPALVTSPPITETGEKSEVPRTEIEEEIQGIRGVIASLGDAIAALEEALARLEGTLRDESQ